MYSCILSLTSALDEDGGLSHTPAVLRYPLYWRLGGSEFRSGRVRKISPLTGIGSPDGVARTESMY
jgi:hypothetical protein